MLEEPSDVLGKRGRSDCVQIDAESHDRQDVRDRIEKLSEDLGNGMVGPAPKLLRQRFQAIQEPDQVRLVERLGLGRSGDR